MKRVIVIFIIISMLFLSGCGGTGEFFDTLVTERALGKTLVKDFFFLMLHHFHLALKQWVAFQQN